METDIAIKIKNASVYIDNKEILHDINWEIKKGEKCFILGANGAGKTTLVKTMLGYIWPLYGAEITVLGKKYGETNLTELRKSIAWVSPFIQQYLDGSLTGLDMVLSSQDGYLGFYRKATDEELEKAVSLLEKMNALHLANKSILGMSSGEQIKVLMAKALLTNPKLIILDEPNVFLDIAEKEFLLKMINKIAKDNPQLTIIFISQRIEDILPVFNKGMILANGKIEQYGDRKTILTEENLKNAFKVNVKLIENSQGRLWAITE